MTVLADPSVWVRFLRRGRGGPAARLDDLLALGEVVVCGPVVAELVAGTPSDQRAELVGQVAARLREQGITTALTDIEIAVAAVHARAELWTHDSDFKRITKALNSLSLFTP